MLLPLALLGTWPSASWAHAFPEESKPGAGVIVRKTPLTVRIQFNAELERVFSTLRVRDSDGQNVSEGEGRVDSSDPTLLLTHVPAVPAGTYHVYWNVVSHDGHRTEGDYTFTIR